MLLFDWVAGIARAKGTKSVGAEGCDKQIEVTSHALLTPRIEFPRM